MTARACLTLTARAEGRAAMETVNANFDKLTAEEERLLAIRTANSSRTGMVLLAINVAGALLILLHCRFPDPPNFAFPAGNWRPSLSTSRAENESLEAAVAERTEHLLAGA